MTRVLADEPAWNDQQSRVEGGEKGCDERKRQSKERDQKYGSVNGTTTLFDEVCQV